MLDFAIECCVVCYNCKTRPFLIIDKSGDTYLLRYNDILTRKQKKSIKNKSNGYVTNQVKFDNDPVDALDFIFEFIISLPDEKKLQK